jgi:hypothetical protein
MSLPVILVAIFARSEKAASHEASPAKAGEASCIPVPRETRKTELPVSLLAEVSLSDVVEFVSGKLATSYRRQLNVQGGVTWCPQWWKHAEAISRFEALWRAWEFLRLDGTTGMSVWWRDHADHHMSVLLSTDGPFKGCTPDDGHAPNSPLYPARNRPRGCSKPGAVSQRSR